MPSAFIYVVPAGVSLVLALLTAIAYWQVGRPYLRVWAIVWAVTVLYYLTLTQVVLASEPRGDTFAMLGLGAALFGWARAVGFWLGTRAMVGRPVGRRTLAALGAATVVWLWLVAVVLAGSPAVAA